MAGKYNENDLKNFPGATVQVTRTYVFRGEAMGVAAQLARSQAVGTVKALTSRWTELTITLADSEVEILEPSARTPAEQIEDLRQEVSVWRMRAKQSGYAGPENIK